MLSVIVPTLNEARALPATLAAVASQPGVAEIIVVDGGSTDATVALARAYPGVRVLTSAPGRAAQMNRGARAARHPMLLFLHADTLLPADGCAQVLAAPGVFGGFRQAFSAQRWDLRLVSWLHNLRCRCTGIFYGDQAMFVRREAFDAAGGYPDVAELEDIRLSETLRAQHEPVFLAATVVTDSRKFEQLGVWRSLYYCLLILVCYELRVPLRGRAFFAAIR